jgi:hypothetical protein
MMSVEAFAAQFTVLATRERWLYVALHFGWAVSFGLRFDRPPPVAASMPMHRGISHWVQQSFAASATVLGLALFAIPYGVMTDSMPAVASAFLAHAVHGLAAACVALGGMAFVGAVGSETDAPAVGPLALAGCCGAIAALGVSRAAELGALQPPVRLAAIICALFAGFIALRFRSRRLRGDQNF